MIDWAEAECSYNRLNYKKWITIYVRLKNVEFVNTIVIGQFKLSESTILNRIASFILYLFDGVHKVLAAGLGDSAQVDYRLFFRHADAVVFDDEHILRLIERQSNIQIWKRQY